MAFKETLNLNICIDDMVDSKRGHKAKNGKTYIDIRVKELDKPDTLGYNYMVYLPQTPEQKAAKEYPTRVGKGNVYDPQNPPQKKEAAQQSAPQTEEEAQAQINDNLPY